MSGALSQIAITAYDLAFQVSPIILQNGIASGSLGGLLPIVALTGQLVSFVQGALTNGISANDFFCRFIPLPGGTLINNVFGEYPFANQQVAANALIQQPLTLSLLMIAPVNQVSGYITKLPIFTALQTSLQQHNLAGGWYNIATPAFVYTNMLMTGMTDVTPSDSKQQQIEWQLDFRQPLITKSQAQNAQNGLLSKLTSGAQIVGQPLWSGATAALNSAIPGAAQLVQNVQGLTGAVNNFLSAPSI
jgi:hypothetical protein